MTQEIMKQLLNLKHIYEPEGFTIIGVFGSWARSEETTGSDIDLLYKIGPGFKENYSGWDTFARIDEIRHEISSILNIEVDLVNFDTIDEVGKHFIIPEVIYF